MLQTTKPDYSTDLSDDYISVTPSARAMLAELMEDADEDFSAIRIYVQGGGCSGMTYSMTFAEDAGKHDSVLDCDTFKILVDPVAISFLEGCEIDYSTEGLNSQFVFKNAFESVGGSGTCAGCGGGAY